MDNGLKITNEGYENGMLLLKAEGRIGAKEAPVLERTLNESLGETQLYLVLNMRHVEYLSSMGIRILLSMYKKALKGGKKFRVENPSEAVRNVLGMVNLDELLLR